MLGPEPRLGPTSSNPREGHGSTEQHGEGEGRPEDLPPAFTVAPVKGQHRRTG
jgi:hypothetical protein